MEPLLIVSKSQGMGKTFPITSDLGPRKYNGTKGIKPTYSKRTLDAEESSVAS